MKKILVTLIMIATIMTAFCVGVNHNKGLGVKEIITETREDFYLEDGEIGIIFNNDNWIVVSNYKINKKNNGKYNFVDKELLEYAREYFAEE